MKAEQDVEVDLPEMEVDQSVFSGPHPLLIDHIVEKIALHLIHDGCDSTLLQSRLVCQTWDRISTRALRFHSNKRVYFGKYFRRPEELLQLRNYLQYSSISNFPIGKFYFCEDIFKQVNLPIVQQFFRDCAPLLTSLTVRLDNQSDLKVNDLNFVNLLLPHLKSLVYDDRTSNERSEIDEPTLLATLVQASPHLRELTVIHPPSSIFDDEQTVQHQRTASEQNVAQMLADSCPSHLTYLNLDIKLNDKVLVTLSEIPVRLSELQLSLRESFFSKEALNMLLMNQAESLINLRLSSMGTKSHFEISFPPLPSLKSLELHSWDSQVQGVTITKFSYKTTFPSLKTLQLHTWAENPGWIQFFPAAYYGTVPSLHCLKLPQNFMYPAMIQNLFWLYPNVTRLDLHYSKETLIIIQRIFTHFSDRLEELKIRDSLPRGKSDICLDSLFTGLPQPVCETILRHKLFNPDPSINYLLKLKNKASLLNLKCLRKLDIEDMLRHETYVTDVTGYLVLLQMPSLRSLTMGRSQIDDDCLRHLAKKYPTNMERELLVPKPPQKIAKTSPSTLLLAGSGPGMISAYNCLANFDLSNSCVIC